MRFVLITLVCLLISRAIVSADKSIMMVNAVRESWIPLGNLTTLLEVSFNVSKCCNVYISGNSAGTENLFNEFLKIYPYEYVVNSRTYNCDGYFIISESADSLVMNIKNTPSVISTTELLIIVDNDIEDTASLFNVSMYGNANANIVALNGLWTLSENYLRPRVFNKILRHNDMVHKRGVVNFEGRELQAAAMFQPPLCYLRTTVNRTVSGIEAEFFEAKNKSELDGVELQLFMLIAQRLNFTWTVRQPSGNARYGVSNQTHWTGGLIGLMIKKEVDIAFSSVWLTRDTYRFTNLTTPWSNVDIHFLVPRPKSYTSFWALTRPLSPEVWFGVFATLIAQSFYVYTRAQISPRIPKRFLSFTVTWTELMGRLLGTWAPRKMQGLEMQFHFWHVIGVLLVTAYSSSLAASLSNLCYEKRIDTPHDFIKANLTWGRRFVTDFTLLFDQNEQYGNSFIELFESEKSKDDRHYKILRGNYAIIGSTFGSAFFPEDYVRPGDLKHLRLMKHSMSKFYSAFAVQPWLLESTDTVMLWLKEGGLVHYHVHDLIHRRTGSALREVMVEHDAYSKSARVLKLTPLAAGFSMLIFGLFMSTVVFCIELHSASRGKSIREVLLKMQRNREVRRVMELKRKRGYVISSDGKQYNYTFKMSYLE